MTTSRSAAIVQRLQELHAEEQRLLIELEIELRRTEPHQPADTQSKIEHKIILSRIHRGNDRVIMTVRRRGNRWIKRDINAELTDQHADVIIDRLNNGIYIEEDADPESETTTENSNIRYVYLSRS